MPGLMLKYIFEHGFEWLVQSMAKDAVGLGFFLCSLDHFRQFLGLGAMFVIAPFAEQDQMLFQTLNRITQWPFLKFFRSAIGAGIVRG
jgi:hypothetical protein